jgi:hypothetical protein
MIASAQGLRVAGTLLRSRPICALFVMSSCVLPIAPEFQDPLAAENYAPFFVDTNPLAGSIVTASPTVPTFTVVVSDPNVGDDLQVRWIADFPPLSDNTSVMETVPVPHSADSKVDFHEVSIQPNCALHHLARIPSHQIYVVVADRPFLPPGTPIDFERLPNDGLKDSRSWILNLDCSVPQP